MFTKVTNLFSKPLRLASSAPTPGCPLLALKGQFTLSPLKVRLPTNLLKKKGSPFKGESCQRVYELTEGLFTRAAEAPTAHCFGNPFVTIRNKVSVKNALGYPLAPS